MGKYSIGPKISKFFFSYIGLKCPKTQRKTNLSKKKLCRSVGRSVGMLVHSIAFEGIRLFTSNLVHRYVSIEERFGLFLRQIGLGEEGSNRGLIWRKNVKNLVICRFRGFWYTNFDFIN